MKPVILTSQQRTESGRNGVKKLRKSGIVPATIYGRDVQPQNLQVEKRTFDTIVRHSASQNILLDLEITNDERSKRFAIVHEVQRHPLSGEVIHIDFQEVSKDQKVNANVPVEIIGDAYGVKTEGGVLQIVLHELAISAIPANLPEKIVIDVTNIKVGDMVSIDEINAPEGVELTGEPTAAVITLSAARVAVTDEEEPAAAATTTATPAAGAATATKAAAKS